MTFAEWLDDRYTVMAADYRRNLAWIVGTCRGYAEGNIWEPRHTAIAIELLRGVSRGTLGTHPEWDEEVFRAARRPDGNEMLRMAEEEINALENLTAPGYGNPETNDTTIRSRSTRQRCRGKDL